MLLIFLCFSVPFNFAIWVDPLMSSIGSGISIQTVTNWGLFSSLEQNKIKRLCCYYFLKKQVLFFTPSPPFSLFNKDAGVFYFISNNVNVSVISCSFLANYAYVVIFFFFINLYTKFFWVMPGNIGRLI